MLYTCSLKALLIFACVKILKYNLEVLNLFYEGKGLIVLQASTKHIFESFHILFSLTCLTHSREMNLFSNPNADGWHWTGGMDGGKSKKGKFPVCEVYI